MFVSILYTIMKQITAGRINRDSCEDLRDDQTVMEVPNGDYVEMYHLRSQSLV